MTNREDFEFWHGGRYRGLQEDIAWAAWKAATLLANTRHKLEMDGVVQVLAAHGNELTNFANNLAKVRR